MRASARIARTGCLRRPIGLRALLAQTAAGLGASLWLETTAVAGAVGTDEAALGADSAPKRPISYFDAEQVRAAFAKGAVLYDGAGGANYMVHASRREAPGQCEVHSRDADVIYVLEGSATFVTGGSCTQAKTTAPDEIRGATVAGGDERRIAKGDVILVPNNTPHWFKAVEGPLLYYVVKVR